MTKQVHMSPQGTLTAQCFAYEVRLTHKPPDAKWRNNQVLLCVTNSVERAIEMAKELYPNDPIIDQAVLRNRSMTTVIDAEVLKVTQ